MMFVPPSFAAGHAILMWYYRRLSQGRPQALLLHGETKNFATSYRCIKGNRANSQIDADGSSL